LSALTRLRSLLRDRVYLIQDETAQSASVMGTPSRLDPTPSNSAREIPPLRPIHAAR
jgi:hypothetical protein